MAKCSCCGRDIVGSGRVFAPMDMEYSVCEECFSSLKVCFTTDLNGIVTTIGALDKTNMDINLKAELEKIHKGCSGQITKGQSPKPEPLTMENTAKKQSNPIGILLTIGGGVMAFLPIFMWMKADNKYGGSAKGVHSLTDWFWEWNHSSLEAVLVLGIAVLVVGIVLLIIQSNQASKQMNSSVGHEDDNKESDIVDNLNELKKLLDDGLLTQEEFEQAKKKVLNC